MNKNDWRLTNQINYLFRKKLIKGGFKPYREGWEHEHCEFCAERIDNTTAEAYSTEDRYHWICKECYNDFKDMFEWEVCNHPL
ncbi:MAG: hypothetical protein E7473_02905 [Ruminococcaceae bacterium]|nr:hypothetical protein [Oscillospiraceae bacterium]